MTEPLDAELLKDLRGQGKPLSFDGNDAEYQDFRFSFRIHMSLFSTVSQQLMDRCEAERNPISLAAVQALGDTHLKSCTQLYYSLALITKGSARTLVRSVEESNQAEAWRLMHSRYAPDTQNRQYAFMQKIMTLPKLWCDPRWRFWIRLESLGAGCRRMGTCVRNCFGRRGQIHSDDESGTDFLRNNLQLGTYAKSAADQLCCNGVTRPETLEQIRPCQLAVERVRMMTTGCKSTLSREARWRA